MFDVVRWRDNRMSLVPRLKIRTWQHGRRSEQVLDLNGAREVLSPDCASLMLVEGRAVRNYDELVELVTSGCCDGKDLIEVTVVDAGMLAGG